MSRKNGNGTEDKRPEPKPRKLAYLWQTYLWWEEFMLMDQRHELRAVAAERGKSNFDAQYERDKMAEVGTGRLKDQLKKQLIVEAAQVCPIWDWLTSIRGLKEGGLSARLIAEIDDPAKFDTISKLWRFAGLAVIDGKAERGAMGDKRHYNSRFKSLCWLIVDQFIKQQTPGYVDIYYAEKQRLRTLHPVPEPAAPGKLWKEDWTDSHVHRMAMRKTAKVFLSHVWLTWREAEGLLVTEPYIIGEGHHEHRIPPPNWPIQIKEPTS